MKELKYTTLEDIKEFLKTLEYNWNGQIYEDFVIRNATIEDFVYSNAKLYIKDNNDKITHLMVAVSDEYFHIIKDNPHMKYDIQDESLNWKIHMLNRKDKSYAKFLISKSNEQKNLLEREYNHRMNLIQKQTEKLKFEKAKELSFLNTTILNAKHRLKKNENDNSTENIADNNL